MGFWDHAEALRGVLLRMAAVIVVLTVGLFAAMPHIFDSVILAPCRGDFILYRWLDSISATSLMPGGSGGDFEASDQHPSGLAVFHPHVNLLLAGCSACFPDMCVAALGLHSTWALRRGEAWGARRVFSRKPDVFLRRCHRLLPCVSASLPTIS